MPTGYTADLYDGRATTAAEYLIGCARAFDYESGRNGKKLEPSTPDTTHADGAILTHEARIAEVTAWSDDDADREAEKVYRAEMERVQEQRAKYDAIQARYESVLADVEAWEPPTELHVGMKEFAVKQLRESLEFDCGTSWLKDPERKSGAVYRADEIASAAKSLSYYREDRAKAIKRTEERNAWVGALLESLPAEVTA